MHHMRSESLSSYLRRCGPLGPEQISVIVARLASVLHSVHRHGYVHRDIKPEHILLNRGAHGELDLHLLDFGVCAADTAPVEERGRERGRVYGTPSYASPEQASGNPYVDARADLFGVGVSLSGDTLVVTANDADHSGISGAGAAWVFTRSGTTWTQQAVIENPDTADGTADHDDDHFGFSVDIDGDTIVVDYVGVRSVDGVEFDVMHHVTRGDTGLAKPARESVRAFVDLGPHVFLREKICFRLLIP